MEKEKRFGLSKTNTYKRFQPKLENIMKEKKYIGSYEEKDGKLTDTNGYLPVPSPVCIKYLGIN